MKKIIIIFLIVIFVGVASYYGYKYYQKRKAKKAMSSVTEKGPDVKLSMAA